MDTSHFKYLLALFLIVFVEYSITSNISPDSKRLYHDIASGRGLYHGFNEITELGGSNFKKIVYNEEKEKLWVVEFYNSWCGHCHRFAPTWKALAVDIYDWGDSVKIGAVDCANDANNQLCRDLEVMYYPMIKIFPPHSNESFLGEAFEKGKINEMRDRIVTKLKSHHNNHSPEERKNLNLKPLTATKLDENLWKETPSEVKYLVLVFEAEDSVVGPTLALDISAVAQEVTTRVVDYSNEHLARELNVDQGANTVVVIHRDLTHTKIEVGEFTRREVNKAVRGFLREHGVDIAAELPETPTVFSSDVDLSDVMHIMQMEEDIKKKLQTTALSSVVFQLDLEGAIRYSLKNEISLHRNISGEHLDALKSFVSVLIKYFPFGQQGLKFLTELKKRALDDKVDVSGKDVRQVFMKLEDEFKPFLPHQGWIGCRGSTPEFRGYPCSLWTLFHTLSVHEELKDRNSTDEKPEVLSAMAGYIKNFFSCSECSAHFTEMAKTIAGNVTTQHDMVMWLWSAHNNVNNRLAGDATEDPQHKKVQFPNKEACPSCYTMEGSWNKSEVFNFLSHMYSNVVYLQPEDLSTTTPAPGSVPSATQYDKNLRHEMYGDDRGFKNQRIDSSSRTLWGFNIFDISLCVLLYICSVAILILVCIKFVFKRSYRKKHYIHDILSKV
ncbi:sulfhydryl oxidase 2-like [Macrosteles quadrilineatus]|uniref:sulfhydryl oxidase 2-like n=1 Tax=Macrosteles quadrilineatus TaxID=74068 RepID=UPI0023E12D21|nr:sulfhydryl oxidase 2-like [Macrosteles quadrilineatus]